MPNYLWIIVVVYALAMIFIFAYSIVQLSLLIRYLRHRKKKESEPHLSSELPHVLVQLPVFNELYVVERLIDAACNLDYPKDKLHIQVLDDSTDESFEVAAKKVAQKVGEGYRIEHVKRPDRKGFKAGALQYGLGLETAPFIAVFDADFVPHRDFLRRALPHFTKSNLGMVQTRWAHLNREYSLLTRVQAFALDAHFTVEQGGRNAGKHFINFNGTAGIWRRECILDAGGWSADTLTEDLDLSYRAQMKGWEFKFLEKVESPAELPAEMNALKNQQYRWNKGAAECARKHLSTLTTRSDIKLSTKLHAFFHLMNSSIFICIVVCAVLSFPLVVVKDQYPQYDRLFMIGGILLFSFFVLGFFYYVAFRATMRERSRREFLWLYPAFLSLSMGMSLHNARAVLSGYMGTKTPFIRTPKWNLVGNKGSFGNKRYSSRKIDWLTWIEGFLVAYFFAALLYGLTHNEWGFIPLHLMLVFGFSAVFFYSLKHSLRF
jgi:cellulose synthase/poly-beta-1,6-N-acetylglucosamine synthase-like glycosyltransferase